MSLWRPFASAWIMGIGGSSLDWLLCDSKGDGGMKIPMLGSFSTFFIFWLCETMICFRIGLLLSDSLLVHCTKPIAYGEFLIIRTQILKKAGAWMGFFLRDPCGQSSGNNKAWPLALMNDRYSDRSRGRLRWELFGLLISCHRVEYVWQVLFQPTSQKGRSAPGCSNRGWLDAGSWFACLPKYLFSIWGTLWRDGVSILG